MRPATAARTRGGDASSSRSSRSVARRIVRASHGRSCRAGSRRGRHAPRPTPRRLCVAPRLARARLLAPAARRRPPTNSATVRRTMATSHPPSGSWPARTAAVAGLDRRRAGPRIRPRPAPGSRNASSTAMARSASAAPAERRVCAGSRPRPLLKRRTSATTSSLAQLPAEARPPPTNTFRQPGPEDYPVAASGPSAAIRVRVWRTAPFRANAQGAVSIPVGSRVRAYLCRDLNSRAVRGPAARPRVGRR